LENRELLNEISKNLVFKKVKVSKTFSAMFIMKNLMQSVIAIRKIIIIIKQ